MRTVFSLTLILVAVPAAAGELQPAPRKTRIACLGDSITAQTGRPDSQEFKIEKVKVGGGKLLRLVINPNQWWGNDLTRIDYRRIERVE